jgi:hypothetical protein
MPVNNTRFHDQRAFFRSSHQPALFQVTFWRPAAADIYEMTWAEFASKSVDNKPIDGLTVD